MKAVWIILWLVMVLYPVSPLQTGIDKGTLFCSRERGNGILHVEKGDHGVVVSGGYPGNYSTGENSGLWCLVHIKGCSTCRVELKFQELSFADCSQKNRRRNKQDKNWCHSGCDHLHVHEVDAPYSDVTHQNYFWEDEGKEYMTISSNVKIRHCAGVTDPEDGRRFRVEYRVLDKTEVFQGMVSPYDKGGAIRSPNFPNGYALNGETFTFMIQNLDPYGHVRLLFDDWDIAPESQVKVYDGVQDNAPHTILSKKSRPVLVSKSNTLVIVLSTGNNAYDCCFYRGFKAHYQYVSETSWGKVPDVKCSEVYPMQGGAIFSFTGPSVNDPHFYDCVWLIKRTNSMDAADGVVLRVQEVLLGNGWLQYRRTNSLEIRDGTTSEAPLLAKYTSKNLTDISYKFFSQHGLYVRLTGGYYSTDKLSFIYTAIKNVSKDGEGCTGYFDFLCNTMVCIDQKLVCDGLDHCGDGSDESPSIDCSVSSMWRHKFDWDKMPYIADQDKSSPGPTCDGIWCGHNCIKLEQICDGKVDCAGREDEDRCAKKRHKFDWDKMPYKGKADQDKSSSGSKCDGIWCGHNCIKLEQVCDGKVDCADRKDEDGCVNQATPAGSPNSSTRIAPLSLSQYIVSLIFIVVYIFSLRHDGANR